MSIEHTVTDEWTHSSGVVKGEVGHLKWSPSRGPLPTQRCNSSNQLWTEMFPHKDHIWKSGLGMRSSGECMRVKWDATSGPLYLYLYLYLECTKKGGRALSVRRRWNGWRPRGLGGQLAHLDTSCTSKQNPAMQPSPPPCRADKMQYSTEPRDSFKHHAQL